MTIKWGVVGTGSIAHAFATALRQTDAAELVAVASRTQESADAFCQTFEGCRPYVGRQALYQDTEVEAVYIASPHSSHADDAIQALLSGKHVLCEKPLALNHAQVMATIHTARRQNLFFMEAFMYRLHPQIAAVQSLIAEGTIGEVTQIQAQFGYRAPIDESSRLFANELAGGGIMDVGCYPISLAHLLLGSPEKVLAHGSLTSTGVDQWAAALLTYADGKTAQVSTAVRLPQKNDAVVFGTKGRIEISDPWRPDLTGDAWHIDVVIGDQVDTISGELNPIYVTQVEHASKLISEGALESPAITWQESEAIANTLDRWRSGVGVEYVGEKQPAPLPAQHRETGPVIPRRTIPGLTKPVGGLVMGCDNQPSMAHAAVMFDHFYSSGGNCFDTAFIYGGGSMEKLLGQWHQSRGVRDDLVIVGKGAHSPECFPEVIGQQLKISLERLATDHVDVYFMHRDNLDVPVGEFVDALNQEVRKGHIGIFGGSNWTLARLREANEYAAKNNLQPFQALSNQLSLARMVEPIWDGVHTANEDDFLAYLTEQQMLLMPWSSQARGFFTEWGASVINQERERASNTTLMEPTADELTRVWFSEENFARRQRAAALAEDLGVDLINIALAFVINQPFPCLPLVGPRSLQECDSCMSALEIELTQEQVDFLSHG